MNVNLRSFAFAAALTGALLSAPAQAATNLGTLVDEWTWFGNTLGAGTSTFTDYYTFTLGEDGLVAGGTFELDIGNWYNVDLSSVSLSGANVSTSQDLNPNDGFSFKDLLSGTYQLAVTGKVTGFTGGAYLGAIHAVAVPVPEPADYAITLVGLAGVAMLMRRRKAR